MSQWYCSSQGQQYGPIDEPTLRMWISAGRVTASDYVWREGMAQWSFARDAMPDAFSVGVSPRGPAQAQGMDGTGGQTPNEQITAQAREILSGRWGLPIGFSLLLGLLVAAVGFVPFIGGIGQLILQGPFTLGAVIFYLSFSRTGTGELGMMFQGFNDFGRALGAYLLIAIFTFLWALLLIVPGIIAGLAYSQAFYLMADDPALGPLQAITLSKQMMDGYKWKLFCLGCRFIGWSLLCLLTCGIGFLWLGPYMSVSYARFYGDLRGRIVANNGGLRGFAVVANRFDPQ